MKKKKKKNILKIEGLIRIFALFLCIAFLFFLSVDMLIFFAVNLYRIPVFFCLCIDVWDLFFV